MYFIIHYLGDFSYELWEFPYSSYDSAVRELTKCAKQSGEYHIVKVEKKLMVLFTEPIIKEIK